MNLTNKKRIRPPVKKEPFQANDVQVGGNHYKQNAIQPWDYITSNNLGYLEGNIVKYVTRWSHKNGLEDLEKAYHYLIKLIEVTQNDRRANPAGDKRDRSRGSRTTG